ncbi:MAG TPA: glucose-6-phosphate isomerase [Candidatus Brocadiia bacterium]|nr:glucose-6-phosphate isomerase [Candidatus Brocadiia bacterium]
MPNQSRLRFDFNNMMDHAVGPEHGLSEAEIAAAAPAAAKAAKAVAADRKAGKLPFMDLPYKTEELAALRRSLNGLPGSARDLVVLGIGGSALGLTALQTALGHPCHNLCHVPRLHVMDNIDPDQFGALLETIDPNRAIFNVITKSGSTAETMSQFLIVFNLLQERGGDWRDRFLVTTDATKGALRRIASEEGFRSFVVPDGVGGRFSVLTPVGLAPAILMGLDCEGLLAGAAAMDERCRSEDPWANPALMGALLQFLMDTKKGKKMAVMMPYSSRLKDVADWFRQLWAESLGKKMSLDGKVVHAGQTPIKALGVTDQHSQMQLYTEGPNDKTFTFLAVDKFDRTVTIPAELKDREDVGYLCGRTMNELLEAERVGAELALTQAQRPNATIYMPRVCGPAIGQLLYLLEVQTALAGQLYNVNAFDQPGVEAGKDAAYALLGRKGYEALRAKIEARPKPREKCVMR